MLGLKPARTSGFF